MGDIALPIKPRFFSSWDMKRPQLHKGMSHKLNDLMSIHVIDVNNPFYSFVFVLCKWDQMKHGYVMKTIGLLSCVMFYNKEDVKVLMEHDNGI